MYPSIGFSHSRIHQNGVALIQVLLTVSMILILVVQLSKGSQDQVDTALQLKQKTQALITIDSVMERTKFTLLTTGSASISNEEIPKQWNFYGEPFSYMGLQVSLQDMAGLISLPFYAGYVAEVSQAADKKQSVENLKLWQGVNDTGVIPSGFRGGYMQYPSEIYQVPGWTELGVPLALTTYFPIYNFNPGTAPQETLKAFAKNSMVDLLLQKRAAKDLTDSELISMIKIEYSDSVSLSPSDTIAVEASFNMGKWRLSRQYMYRINLQSPNLIRQIGY